MSTITNDAELFREHLARHLGNAKNGGIMAAIDVITRDDNPDELLAVVCDADDLSGDWWYSTGRIYETYQHAFTAIGAAIDAINTEYAPISWNFER